MSKEQNQVQEFSWFPDWVPPEADLFGYPDSLIRARSAAAYREGIAKVPIEGKIIADIGSGYGHGVLRIGLSHPDLVISADRHRKFLVNQHQFLNGRINDGFVHLNLFPKSHLPFQEQSLDAIFFVHVVEHIPLSEIGLLLEDFNRVLKNNGDVVIATPNRETLVADNPLDENDYSYRELSDLLSQHFDNVSVYSLIPNNYAHTIHSRKRSLARIPGARLIRDHFLPQSIQELILGSGGRKVMESDFSCLEGNQEDAIDLLAIAQRRN